MPHYPVLRLPDQHTNKGQGNKRDPQPITFDRILTQPNTTPKTNAMATFQMQDFTGAAAPQPDCQRNVPTAG
ncbi:BQ5605_C039g11800 [Microbotryum silenes-dioicae]|uniref:BQ5605_C039g11800 protein n=1 Tax=Microbotryum silenes-dioicae TaxID=796604 RepID=A0A2X0N1F5_9BASI|nr:BQ5605_C039g11800 [Microbotryum silenes-dioicae]